MTADKPSKKRIDDLKRKIKGWLKSRSNLAEASGEDFQFVLSTTHGTHTVFIGLTKEPPDHLIVLYEVAFPEETQRGLLELYPSDIEYLRFRREVGRDLMEPGVAFLFREDADKKLVGFQTHRVLFPFDEPDIGRQELEDAIQNVITPALRVIYYLNDILGLPPGVPGVTEPSQPFGPGRMFG